MFLASNFQNSLSTFSIKRVNAMPLWDFCVSNSEVALKIIIVAELFIVMTISPGKLKLLTHVEISVRCLFKG